MRVSDCKFDEAVVPLSFIIRHTLARLIECLRATRVNGVEALALLESGEKFDVLLSNLRMPRLDGNALLERTRDKFPDLPFVMESGTGDVSLLVDAVRNGAFAYLHSPFRCRELLGVVRRALEYRQMRCK
jgi:two-component system C4-dicarboxylate transport response regulator DctD